jgi:hypothetical protein
MLPSAPPPPGRSVICPLITVPKSVRSGSQTTDFVTYSMPAVSLLIFLLVKFRYKAPKYMCFGIVLPVLLQEIHLLL